MCGSILSWLIEKLLERNIDVAQTYTTSPFPFHQCHMSILQLSCHFPPVKHWCPSPEWPVILNTLHPPDTALIPVWQFNDTSEQERPSWAESVWTPSPKGTLISLLLTVDPCSVKLSRLDTCLRMKYETDRKQAKMIGREAYGYGYAVQQKTKKRKDN